MKNIIPFFNYQYLYKKEKRKIDKVIQDVLKRGAYILQEDLKKFEKNAANFIKAKHLIGVANGTDAMILGFKAFGVKKDDEIIIPSHTYIATAAAIKLVGAKPILCECLEDGMMDPSDIEKRITKKTIAIMPVQLNGRCCDMDRIIKIAKNNSLKVFEDAAQGYGSKYKNRYAGTFGLFGTISFYPAKLLGCYGDGGAVVTNDDNFARKIKLLRDHGRDKKGNIIEWGFNSRLDNLQAAILDLKLKTYYKDILKRRKIASFYQKKLGSIKKLILPPQPTTKVNFDVYQNYEIQCERRNGLKKYLEKNGVRTLIQWNGKAVHQIKPLRLKSNLKFTDKYFNKCLMLPMNTSLTSKELRKIVRLIQKFYD
tara:strand:+ start:1388 stop:2491 length:1104 start_codon:yes stop_codon:yes gene_type:complete